MLWLSYRSEMWQAYRQRRCRCGCQISERLEKSRLESLGFETSQNLAVRRPSALWLEARVAVGRSGITREGICRSCVCIIEHSSEINLKPKSLKISFAQNVLLSNPIVWRFCTEHDSDNTSPIKPTCTTDNMQTTILGQLLYKWHVSG